MSATDTRAVVQQLLSALELGRDYANTEFLERSRTYANYPHRYASEREDVASLDAALEAGRAFLAALPEQPAAPQGDSVAGSGLPLDTVRTGEEGAQSDERIDALLFALDEVARDYDSHEYGLPMYSTNEDGPLSKMRELVRAALGAVSVPAETASGARPQDEHAHPVIGVVLPSQSVRIGGEGEKE